MHTGSIKFISGAATIGLVLLGICVGMILVADGLPDPPAAEYATIALTR
jgi:glutamine amidotransferase PdxT